jgi:hypothetical protein
MTWLEFTILLYCWLNAHSMVAAQRNVTIDDIDPSIVYSPANAWYPNSENCRACLNPSAINSHHEGIHLLPPYPNAFTSASPLSQPTGVLKETADDVGLADLKVTLKFNFSGPWHDFFSPRSNLLQALLFIYSGFSRLEPQTRRWLRLRRTYHSHWMKQYIRIFC